jgi:hypothetical protein
MDDQFALATKLIEETGLQEANTDMLYDEIITHPYYAKDVKAIVKKILQIYEEVFKDAHGEPTFMDVTSSVAAYNEQIFNHIAVAELIEEGAISSYDGEDEIEELVSDKITSIIEYYAYNEEYYDLDSSILKILMDHRCFVTIDDDSAELDSELNASEIIDTLPEKGKYYSVNICDCQNPLIPEFAINGFMLQNDTILYHPGEWDKLWTI